jgi:hypothetical protein
VPTPVDAPAGDDAAAWQAWHAGHCARLSALSPQDAARRAYGIAQAAWHRRHGERPDLASCPGCGERIAVDHLALPDGARVHLVGQCLELYGTRWRGTAATRLRALGIEPPVEW